MRRDSDPLSARLADHVAANLGRHLPQARNMCISECRGCAWPHSAQVCVNLHASPLSEGMRVWPLATQRRCAQQGVEALQLDLHCTEPSAHQDGKRFDQRASGTKSAVI